MSKEIRNLTPSMRLALKIWRTDENFTGWPYGPPSETPQAKFAMSLWTHGLHQQSAKSNFKKESYLTLSMRVALKLLKTDENFNGYMPRSKKESLIERFAKNLWIRGVFKKHSEAEKIKSQKEENAGNFYTA